MSGEDEAIDFLMPDRFSEGDERDYRDSDGAPHMSGATRPLSEAGREKEGQVAGAERRNGKALRVTVPAGAFAVSGSDGARRGRAPARPGSAARPAPSPGSPRPSPAAGPARPCWATTPPRARPAR